MLRRVVNEELSVPSFPAKIILDEKRPKPLKPLQQVEVRRPPNMPLLDGGRDRHVQRDRRRLHHTIVHRVPVVRPLQCQLNPATLIYLHHHYFCLECHAVYLADLHK